MSTAELSMSTWIQSENTLDYGPVWTGSDEQEDADRQDGVGSPSRGRGARDAEPGLPDDFWQGWFGLWT